MKQWVVSFALLASCTGNQRGKLAEGEKKQPCSIAQDDIPELVVLSSSKIGGVNSSTVKAPYTGNVPPAFVLYRSGKVLFAKNIGKSPNAFFGYQCVQLSDEERANITGPLAEDMPETFEFFDAKDKTKGTGITEVLSFKTEFECSQFELKGSVDGAKAVGGRSRSSVAVKVPESIISAITSLNAFSHPNALPWFPETVLLEMQLIPNEKAAKFRATAKAWPKGWEVTKVDEKEWRIRPAPDMSWYTAPMTAARMKEFATLARGKVIMNNQIYRLGYRFIIPSDRLWAAPFPSEKEEYSVCNRFIARNNFGKLYGLNYLDVSK
jgi:hypothetical protein